MKRQASGFLLAIFVAAALFALTSSALPARAEINGNCSATINGVDVGSRSTGATSDAIEVKEHTAVPVIMQSPDPIIHLRVQIEFAGFRWTVRDEPTSGTSWQNNVPVDKYAKYGVGLYKVIGQSVGPAGTCSGSALVRVEGNPLTTVVGAVAVGVTAIGVVGMATAAARSVSQKPIAGEGRPWWWGWCLLLVLPALLITSVAMVTGGGAGGVPAAPGSAQPRRARWGPRISLVGLLGGLLAGAGVVVLLQQYAVVYPTRAVAIEGLVGGLAVGIILPSLARMFAVRRFNRTVEKGQQLPGQG